LEKKATRKGNIVYIPQISENSGFPHCFLILQIRHGDICVLSLVAPIQEGPENMNMDVYGLSIHCDFPAHDETASFHQKSVKRNAVRLFSSKGGKRRASYKKRWI